jgi:hypothetical protein
MGKRQNQSPQSNHRGGLPQKQGEAGKGTMADKAKELK